MSSHIDKFTGAGGVSLSMYNTDASMAAFAEASMNTTYLKTSSSEQYDLGSFKFRPIKGSIVAREMMRTDTVI
ncbi:NADP-dependent isocitrate dehydrogenase 1 [Artemisia annua]|uniref:NADP-dependent isocitrate dehydrogenase 1 n=1 Tax=Artemisia annua TaxID=35608 RepID=A0A2U1LBM4_ARTAN|nr:NADP-dependent isocitrate dehydrogenase 1 [Artemisia annua]